MCPKSPANEVIVQRRIQAYDNNNKDSMRAI